MDLTKLLGKLRGYDKHVDERILNIYQWGSRVYGTNTPESDWDFIIVSTKSYPFTQPNTLIYFEGKPYNPGDFVGSYEIFDDGEVNVTFVESIEFKCMIMSHRLEMLESLFLPSENLSSTLHYIWLKQVDIEFKLDLEVFRRSVSWEAVRTSHKAEVKMMEGNIKKGKKELFHAIRYFMFALQIIRDGKIIDFTQADPWWDKIRDTDSNTWDAHKQLFMPLFHNLRSQFISECPLGVFHSKVSLRPPILLPSDISPIQNPTTPIYKQQKELKVVQLIKSMGLEDFSRKFGVVSHRHSNHPNLVFLTYDVWIPRGGFSDGAIKECNGIVLDEFANWNVICYPYNKFFCLGMGSEQIDWNTAMVHEKLDGNLCVLFHYSGKWIVSSKDSIAGTNLLCSTPTNPGRALNEVFWEVWELSSSPKTLKCMCYMFELLHPQNRYAVKYEKRIVLHGVRNMQSLEETDPVLIATSNGWEVVKQITTMDVTTKENIQAVAKQLNCLYEGFVVRDADFNRVIIKAPYHVSLMCLSINCTSLDDGVADLMATTVSRREMLDMTRHNDEAEFSCYFPQWTNLARSVREKFETFVSKVENILLNSVAMSSKDFAISIQALSFRSLMFTLRKTPVPPREYLASFDLKKLYVYTEEEG